MAPIEGVEDTEIRYLKRELPRLIEERSVLEATGDLIVSPFVPSGIQNETRGCC